MKLLIEKITDFETTQIVEQTSPTKGYWISGPFLQAEIRNRNNRVYRKQLLEKAVTRYVNEKINDSQAVGELGHPDIPQINFERVSHKIVSLQKDGNNWIGKAKIIDTPFGKIVQNLMDEGIKFGVSSRGLGSLEEKNGILEVQDDYFIITPADIVSDPSAPDAYVTSVMENKEWVWENDKLYEKEIAIKTFINKVAKKSSLNEETLLNIFTQILQRIGRRNRCI